VTPGTETVMEIEAEITLRQPVQQLGLAPFSSMFWFGELTHPRAYDFRPEVHDSDGLLMELSTGAKHFRPLDHTPDQFRHCVFTLEKAQSWSLLQRDRSFLSYQDVEAHYHDRPSVRVEPLEGFDKGQLHLIEMPTLDETNDNVILVFEPDPKPETGKPFHYKYRLIWQRDPAPSGLFAVKDTRYGHPVQKPGQLLFTIDFAKPLVPEKKAGDPKWDDISGYKPVVTTNNPAVRILHADITDLSMANVDSLPLETGRNPGIHMPQVLRAFFVLEPPAEFRDIDLTCELQNAEGKTLSERWLYLWKKP
jgi:glucans biosynthesis protein